MQRHNLLYMLKHPSAIIYNNFSYSQEGEDMILRLIFHDKNEGFYVDIGAHHPLRFSNTMYFYSKGWRGLNVDATPGSMKLFDKFRPRDINVEAGIAEKNGELDFYRFKEGALNTFDEKCAKESIENGEKLLGTDKVPTFTLQHLIDTYCPNQRIDILDIDVEGLDEVIIQNIDFSKIKPKVIMCEYNATGISNIHTILEKNNYKMVARTVRTAIYKCEE